MWYWLAPLLLIAILIAYLIFAPFYVLADSTIHFYGIRFHRLANARLLLAEDSLKIDLVVAWWRKRFDLLKKTARSEEKSRPLKKKKTKKRKSIGLSQVMAVLKTFRVKKFYVDADTRDPALNGILYPCFYWVGKWIGKPVSINFSGKNIFILQAENNLARIAKSIIYSYLKQKKHGKSE